MFAEEKGEPKQIRTEVLLLTSLTPYCQVEPAHARQCETIHLYKSPEENAAMCVDAYTYVYTFCLCECKQVCI